MRIPSFAAGLFAVGAVVFAACGGKVTTESTTAASSSSSSSGMMVCTPGQTQGCYCHLSQGSQTCLPDGSGFGECGPNCGCPAGRSDGCCPGDGICCACIPGCNDPFSQAPEVDAFIKCVCDSPDCVTECGTACVNGGIPLDCAACAAKLGHSTCMAEYKACGGI